MKKRLFKLFISSVFLLLCTEIAFSQNFATHWQPSFSYIWDYSEKTSFKSRTTAYQSISDLSTNSSLVRVESSVSIKHEINERFTFFGRYLFRLNTPLVEGGPNENRITEQITYTSKFSNYSTAQRLRIDHHFIPDNYQTRVRYKFGATFPLKKSAKSTYLVISDEILAKFADQTFSGGNRIEIGTGWNPHPKRKIEISVEYRTKNYFIDTPLERTVVISTTFNFKH